MEDAEIDLRRLFSLLQRRLRLICMIAFGTLCLAILVLLFFPQSYTATSLVGFDPSRKDLLNPDFQNSSAVADNARLEGEIELLRSDALLLQLMEQENLSSGNLAAPTPGLRGSVLGWIGFYKPPTLDANQQRDILLGKLRRMLSVQRRGLTYLIAIQAQAGTPEMAADLANGLTRIYLKDQIQSKIDGLLAARDVVQSRLDEARQEIIKSEAEFNAFVQGSVTRIAAVSGDDSVRDLSIQLNELATRRATLELETSGLSQSLRSQDWASLEIALNASQSTMLVEQRQVLAKKLGPDSSVASNDEWLGDATGSGIELTAKAVLSDLQQELGEVAAWQRDLQVQLQDLVMRNNLPTDILTEMYDLQSKASFARDQYQVLLARSLEMTNQATLQVADSQVVSPALPPTAPYSPNTVVFLAIGLLGGLLLGTITAVVYESMVGGFMTEEQLEATLKTRIAATVPRLRLSDGDDVLADMMITAPLSLFSEAMRRTRLTIDQATRLDGRSGQVAMVTSAVAGEGKSTIALALARSYALSGRKTLLIDCDLRQSAIAEQLDLAPQSGLLDLLDPSAAQGQLRSSLRQESDSGLTMILGAEGTDRSMDTLLAGQAFEQLVQEARSHFDMVILDTPPVGPVVDALYVAPLADIILLLTRWASTSQRDTRHALASLSEAKRPDARVIGVMNDKAEKRPKPRRRHRRSLEADFA